MDISREKLQQIIEGALLAYGQPMKASKLMDLFVNEENPPTKEEIQAALEDIQSECKKRGFELKEVNSGFRFQVKQDLAPWVNLLWDEKPAKYSRAVLETLSLIAYRQPITRGDIEEIRGVAVSSHIIRTLMERDWVRIVGHRDVPGRPALYASTRQFLDYFNLRSLDELPALGEIKDLDELNKELEFAVGEEVAEAAEGDTQTELALEPEPQGAITDEDEIEMLEAELETKGDFESIDEKTLAKELGLKPSSEESEQEATSESDAAAEDDGVEVEAEISAVEQDETAEDLGVAVDESGDQLIEDLAEPESETEMLDQDARISFADLVQRQLDDDDFDGDAIASEEPSEESGEQSAADDAAILSEDEVEIANEGSAIESTELQDSADELESESSEESPN